MGFGTVFSAAINGLDVELIQVEADISNGLPMFHMVGYLSAEVKEAAERVRTAIKNIEIQLPAKKTIINLSPGDVKKRGASFDLPIAVSVMAALNEIDSRMLEKTLIIGELSLDGAVQKVAGVLPIVREAKRQGFQTCILPWQNVWEGTIIEGIKIIGIEHLKEAYLYLGHKKIDIKESPKIEIVESKKEMPDFKDVRGQSILKRAIEVAVAGGHNLLLLGPPGSGKSMAAKRIPGILPTLSFEESMEITKIYSVIGMLEKEHPLIRNRPFREVHHSISKTALIGGGRIPKPGEISLAHKGVLFLDELAEFQKPVLEALRQPLEEKNIRITRNQSTHVFPAECMLVSALNPCPCGNYPDYERCACTLAQIQRHLGKISYPFLNRMDICVEVPKVPYQYLKSTKESEPSSIIKERVERARQKQLKRYGFDCTNTMLNPSQIQEFCSLQREEEQLMEQAFQTLELTARTYHKVLKVARTIADLDDSEKIKKEHLREAIGYRSVDKKFWGR